MGGRREMVRKEEEVQGRAFQMAVGWNILDNERRIQQWGG